MISFPPLHCIPRCRNPLFGMLILLVCLAPPGRASRAEAAVETSTDTIVLTEDDLEAFERALKRGREADAAGPADPDELFEATYGFPFARALYWHWLGIGALSPIVPIEQQIDERRQELLRALRGRGAAFRRTELEQLDGEIRAREQERDQILAEYIAEIELTAPADPILIEQLAVFYCALALNDLWGGRTPAALRSLDRAAGLLPDEPLIAALQGIALHQDGQIRKAQAALQRALTDAPRLVMALIARAELYEADMEYNLAADSWDRAARVSLDFPRGIEDEIDRLPGSTTTGDPTLRRAWSDHFEERLRMARLRDFAHRFYPERKATAFEMTHDASIGVPPDDEAIARLREMVRRYLQDGRSAVDQREVEQVYEGLNRRRVPEIVDRIVSTVSETIATARRDAGDRFDRRIDSPDIVVLHNPAVWDLFIVSPSTYGVYRPPGASINVYIGPDTQLREIRDITYHEIGHFAVRQIAGPRQLPLWLVEGIADRMAVEAGYDRYAEDPYLSRWRSIWLATPVGYPWFEKERALFTIADHYRARRAIEILEAQFGLDRVGALLASLGRGEDLDTACRSAFKMTCRELQGFLITRLPFPSARNADR